MSDITKTFCPDCKREVLNVVGFIADGWEFTCGKCNQRFVVRIERKLTKRTPDVVRCAACQSTNAFEAVICVDCCAHTAPRR